MNNNQSFTTSIVTVVAIIAVLVLGYFYLTGTSATEQPLTTSSVLSVSGIRVQSLSSQLTSLTFDTSILSDTRFVALKDIATPITPQSIGRSDPFAPI